MPTGLNLPDGITEGNRIVKYALNNAVMELMDLFAADQFHKHLLIQHRHAELLGLVGLGAGVGAEA